MSKKTRIIVAIIGFVALFVAKRRHDQYLESWTVPETPELPEDLKAWAEYVERYPELTDDPKIRNAMMLLKDDENPS